MAGKTPAGPPPPGGTDDDSDDWASALDEWDAKLDDALGGADPTIAAPLATVPLETMPLEAPPLETVRLETVRLETVRLETVRLETVRLETVRLETMTVPPQSAAHAEPATSADDPLLLDEPLALDDSHAIDEPLALDDSNALDEPLPLDEPPPLDGFALEIDTAPQRALPASPEAEEQLRALFGSDELVAPAAPEGTPETESPFDANEEPTGVFDQRPLAEAMGEATDSSEASDVTHVHAPPEPEPQLAPPVASVAAPAPPDFDHDDDDLEISVELSSALERAAEAADLTVAVAPPSAMLVDDDFYDDIAIVPARDEPSAPRPAPKYEPVEEPEAALWSEPALPVQRDENDPDRTPLPVAEDEPGSITAFRLPPPRAPSEPIAPPVQRDLVAARPTRPEGISELAVVTDVPTTPVSWSEADRREFLGLLDTERLLADGPRAGALAFEAARLCGGLGDLAGAGERLEATLRLDADHAGALTLERRRAIAAQDLERASAVNERARAVASPRERKGLTELGAVLADRRGLHREARALEAELGASGEAAVGHALAAIASASDRAAPLAALRELVPELDARLRIALDLELAREAERGALDEAKLRAAGVERYRAVLASDARSLAAALGLFRTAIRLTDRALERDALERIAEALPESALRTTIERRAAALALAEGNIDAGRSRLAALADAGDELAALVLLDEAGGTAPGDADLARLSRLIDSATDAGQRASLRIALGAAEEARGGVGAAIAAYAEAAREWPADRRAERALERTRALGGDKQTELDRHLRIAGTDEARAPRSLVRAASLLVELGRTDEALTRLDAALEQSPLDGEALGLFARVATATGAHPRLAAHLIAAADASPDAAFAYTLRRRAAWSQAHAGDLAGALVLAMAGDPGEAADLARRYGTTDTSRVRDFLGELAERASPTDAARLHVERASLAPNAVAATEDLRQAIAVEPRLRGAVALATRALRAKDPDLCASLLADRFAVLTDAPGEERALAAVEVALALAEDGEDLDGAARLLGAVGGDSPRIAPELLRVARRRGQDPGLTTAYERALAGSTGPDERAAIHYDWSRIAARGGDRERTVEQLRLAFEAVPDSRVHRDALERAWERAGDAGRLSDLALTDLKEAEDTRRKVAAYGRLAYIDEVLRGDAASARMSYESIAELDQNNHDTARRLERALITEKRGPDLIHLYERLGLSAAEPSLAVAICLERARLRRRVAGSELPLAEVESAVDNDLRLALFQDAHSRPALREAYARATERRDTAARGELAMRLAENAGAGDSPDLRASAIFLTRAAQSAVLLGKAEEALTRFRSALTRVEAHLPALLGLLDCALREGNASAAADAAEQLQRVHREPGRRRDAGLLAAALAARDLGDRPRAVLLLRAVLEADPHAELAFARLRVLLLEGEEWAALADLLEGRLGIETDERRLLALHVELGELARDRLADLPRAREHLGAALKQDPLHPGALGALADLEERDAHYAEAADLLLRRAKVERSRPALGDLLFRLGSIYTRQLNDGKRAIACLQRVLQVDPRRKPALELLADAHVKESDWAGAFAALQSLSALEVEPTRRIEVLHRAARIQEDGFRDVRQALSLYRAALEVDPLNLTAIEVLAQFFDRQSDTQSLRVLIDTTARRLRAGLSGGPRDAAAYHALFRVFMMRRAPDRAALTAGVLGWMGSIDEAERQALDRLRTREQYPGGTLADPSVDELLFDARVPAGFRNLMRLVEDSLLKTFRGDVKQLGVQRAERLPKSGHAMRDIGNRIAADLGVREFDLYLSPALRRGAMLELADPIAICVGSELIEGAHELELRFLFTRFFKMAQMRLALALRLEPDALAALIAGVIRLFTPDFSPPGIEPALVIAETTRMQKLIPRKLHAELQAFAFECAAPSLDLRALAAGVAAAADRAGLLACGAPGPALAMLERMGRGDAARALALFAVGDELPELRRLVGTSIG